MGFGRPKKDKFADLDDDFKDNVAAKSEVEIRDLIAKTSLDQAALMEAKDLDMDFKMAKETAKEAGAVYREGTKANKLRIAFARQVLNGRGKDSGSFGQE